MKWFKKIFGKKEKPNKSYIPKDLELEERKISPLLTPEDKSVPLEENVMDIVSPSEPIAPTLERQDEDLNYDFESGMITPKKIIKIEEKQKPDDDRSSWPKGRNFNL